MTITRSTIRLITLGTLAILLLAGCLNDSAETSSDFDEANISGTAVASPTATATVTPSPTVSSAPWLPALLEPGPPALVSPVLFFLNGPDVWLIDSDLTVRQVTRERRVRAVETAPGSATAAIVLIVSQGGREAEEVRIVDAEGNESEPVYGPEIVEDPGGNPHITSLAWSPNGEQLAILRDDGSIWLGGAEQPAQPLDIEPVAENVEQLRWSPAGDALLLVIRSDGAAGSVRIIPTTNEGYYDIAPLGSIGSASWLPGQPRLVVAEDRAAGFNPHAGSLFTIRLDGIQRNLLVSAGRFGPVISIGDVLPSPDGTHLAFTVETPNQEGDFEFQSLYLLEISSGVQRKLPVARGQSVSDLWWFEGGLAWRAVSEEEGPEYDGVEPFIIEVSNLETGETRLVYTSGGA